MAHGSSAPAQLSDKRMPLVQAVVVGADHGGFLLKESLKKHLEAQGVSITDVGCFSADQSVDYPNVAQLVVAQMAQQPELWGIICCGSGVGVAMAANRFAHIRAVVAHDVYLAEMSRRHNNANVLCMGGRIVAPEFAVKILETWLATPFEGARHEKRIAQLSAL